MIDQEIEAIRAFVKTKRRSRRHLARDAGVHRNTLANMFQPCWNPTAETIRALRVAIDAAEMEYVK